ncbi:MAG TPA: helix-turn-helix domain-containing protein, partial [Tepidisphaeraceae bacterium]|nr:helix-turn-helix domain-containing protein [Tepidisphaeraceae bacterium]
AGAQPSPVVESTEPSEESTPAGAPAPSLEEMEQRHILAVLEKNGGNRTATATELGISLRKLYYRLGQYQKQGLIP